MQGKSPAKGAKSLFAASAERVFGLGGGKLLYFKLLPLIRPNYREAGFQEVVRGQIDRLPSRRIKTQTVLPCAETVPMLLWALMASGQIQMRKVDGWETLSQPIEPITLDLAA